MARQSQCLQLWTKQLLAHTVRAYFSARWRRSVRRFEMMKLERERSRREFLRRKERERLMYMMIIAISCSVLASTSPVKEWLQRWREVVNGGKTWSVCLSLQNSGWRIFACRKVPSSAYVTKCDPWSSVKIPNWGKLYQLRNVSLSPLWFYATGADYRTIGPLFGVSKFTVSLVVNNIS